MVSPWPAIALGEARNPNRHIATMIRNITFSFGIHHIAPGHTWEVLESDSSRRLTAAINRAHGRLNLKAVLDASRVHGAMLGRPAAERPGSPALRHRLRCNR